ncbi:uncharacterized protein AMSG_07126 [Thecamonas trahens ATCC 50062]|uniref:N-alpha-acetyltransferase 35, NatC auxiliary subunit n=1 Tax=Thecamonas trahens ATCC 50062 TaxID=461836 RepID=A0A0L0DFG0_THETB|nr:hypothetical protein AMSG_07126 [Thecamonas trahens ATCC 50062]KNC50891.1 hypothetical protein AMSG_07126 [Thecamonas trahens ATCC 50062]|eukprot:XP_013756597.1 hypothetical protein AMSG_07126 [Thecamonas trahens ATCC 50062]
MSKNPPPNDEHWEDITPALHAATESLAEGQLLFPHGFRLTEAMSSIELMAPKMDMGMTEKRVASAEERVAAGELALAFDETTEAGAVALVEALEALVVAEAMFMSGINMVQSLFAVAALPLRGQLPPGSPLGIALDGFVACSTLLMNALLRADVHEEEDFVPGAGGLVLPALAASPAEVAMALEAEAARIGGTAEGNPALARASVLLLFWATFIQVQIRMDGAEVASSGKHRSLSHGRKKLTTAVERLDQVLGSLAESLSPEEAEARIAPALLDVNLSLDAMVPGLIAVQTTMPRGEALSKLRTHVRGLASALEVAQVPDTLDATVRFVTDFSHFSDEHDFASRARLSLLVLARNELQGGTPIVDAVRTSLAFDYGLSDEMMAACEANQVFTTATLAFRILIQSLSFNRARMRSQLMARAFDAWLRTQNAAFQAAQPAIAAAGGKWTPDVEQLMEFPRYYLVSIMTLYTQLGFELELYSTRELTAVFWYLDYFLGLRYEMLRTRLARHAAALEQLAGPAGLSGKRGKKKGKGKKKGGNGAKKKAAAARAAREAAVAATREQILESSARKHVLCGLFRLCVGLTLDGRLSQEETLYGSPRKRFEQRFGLFARVYDPEALTYDRLIKSINPEAVAAAEVFSAASDSFAEGQAHLVELLTAAKAGTVSSWGTERGMATLKALTRVVISNGIATRQLAASSPESPASGAERLACPVYFVMDAECVKDMPRVVVASPEKDGHDDAVQAAAFRVLTHR